MSLPLIDVVKNVSGGGMVESGEEFQSSIVSNRELEKGEECLRYSLEGTICLVAFVYIPSS